MSSAPSAEAIARNATWLAQALDPSAGLVRLVAMDRTSYRIASFLDDRLFQQPISAQIVPWPEVEAAMAGDHRSDARWIFHIGHVGSTLISRLIGELDSVLALREPRLLRDLAMTPPEGRANYLPPVGKLMSRTLADDEFACVKVTSFGSEIAAELMPAGSRALFLYASPRNYIASILAGENSVKELGILADSRAERLAARVSGFERQRQSYAHLAAAAWACEMTALEANAEAMGDRSIAWADFDRMLLDMASDLRRVADHFGFAADDHRIDAIAGGPLMSRYSKGLEYDYSPDLRRELISDAVADHRRDIDSALAMLHSAAEESPYLARALARAEG
jgi:hypothetical protein